MAGAVWALLGRPGAGPRKAKGADRIRRYVLDHYIEPAREQQDATIEVRVRDVHTALGLKDAWPNVCQALAGRKFQELAMVPEPTRIGPEESSATVYRFDLRDTQIDSSALNELRDRFLAICPDFRSFADPGSGWAKEEKTYKIEASHSVRLAKAESEDDETLGRRVFEILQTAKRDGPLVRWQTEHSIAKGHPELLDEFHAVIGRLTRSVENAEQALFASV